MFLVVALIEGYNGQGGDEVAADVLGIFQSRAIAETFQDGLDGEFEGKEVYDTWIKEMKGELK